MIMKFLTYSHILAGIISLIVAPIAMTVVKGGPVHRLFGKIFFWCMVYIFVTAIILGLAHDKLFLVMVSVLSFYLAFTGYRTLAHKQISKNVRWYDWAVTIGAGLFMLGFGAWGAYLLTQGVSGTGVYLLFGFSAGGLLAVRGEVQAYVTKRTDKDRWLFNHIGRMVGSFIASVTAFSVNVLVFLPGIWPWIWPTLIGTPFIVYWIRTYKKRIAEGARVTDLVQLKR